MTERNANELGYRVKTFDRIADIPPAEWDNCAGLQNPFESHAYLSSLEETGDVSPATGFQPHHLGLYNNSNQLIAVVPAYIKNNSDAEIGSDLGWSLAHDRMCGPYYPKLQVEIPFTPVSGSRFLITPGANRSEIYLILLVHLKKIVTEKSLSSLHFNFIDNNEKSFFAEAGLLINMGIQFQWDKRGHKSFEEFILSLRTKRRTQIRRERKRVKKENLKITTLSGKDITSNLMSEFFYMYKNTYERYGSKSFLSQDFFQVILKTMSENLVFITVHEEGKFIAATLSFKGSNTYFAQHWGCHENIKFLHFEVTYYKGMDYCFKHGLSTLHAGPGGSHKANRALLPSFVNHAHWFRDEEFGAAIEVGLKKKIIEIKKEQEKLSLHSPYKEGC